MNVNPFDNKKMQFNLTTKFNFYDKVFVVCRQKDNSYGIVAATVERIKIEPHEGGRHSTWYNVWRLADKIEGEEHSELNIKPGESPFSCWLPESSICADLEQARKKKKEYNEWPF